MKPLFPIEKLSSYKSTDKVPFECKNCNNIFHKEVKYVRYRLKKIKKQSGSLINFCSFSCSGTYQAKNDKRNTIIANCKQCNKQIKVVNSVIKKSKTGNFFCSHSCSATYNNTHKKHGTRRSKLEFWIEMKLEYDFPDLKVIYNDRETTGLELDIYFPDLKLAVELNGIFHYEPIYGEEKLEKIQNKEKQKFKTCLEKNIDLLIIDISSLNYFKSDKADVFYNIIKNILTNKYEPTKKTIYPDFKDYFKLKQEEYLLNNYKEKYDNCPGCNGIKLIKRQFCSNKCKYNIKWDSIDIIEELKTKNCMQIAKELGCSWSAVYRKIRILKQIQTI